MNYTEAVDYIFSVPRFTKKNDAANTRELMRRLNNPGQDAKVIHVAGSNGKGSVCAFLSAMLVKAEKHTGLFTSPHLVKINERFQIDGKDVDDNTFLEAYEAVHEAILSMVADGFSHPTYFELIFATAMVIFERQNVEYIVLETGLGGRLDATNIVAAPIATVITSISLEHTEILGERLEEVAAEKAGIIKAGVPVIYDGSDKKAEVVIRKKAKEQQAPLFPLYSSMYKILANTEKSIDFLLDYRYYENTEITIPGLAEYQVQNSALALIAMNVIDAKREILVPLRLSAIKETVWQGRMETVMDGVVFDGAHNAGGIAEFVKTAQHVQKKHRIVLLFSAVLEKDYEQMIAVICKKVALSAVIVTEIGGERKIPAKELAETFGRYTKAPVTVCKKTADAFTVALQKKQDGFLFCVGSLYLIGELKRIIEENYR